jgi:glycerate kinase
MNEVKLNNRHLIILADIAIPFLGENSHVNMVYYPQKQTLLLAPATDELFKGLHKTSMQMIKNKNLTGDKSISLEEMLIDNEIDDANRPLTYKLDQMNIMQVYL